MANALKNGLVAYYPLQSNAVNMVDGVAGTINGTASWVKNQAGKVVLDDTTASVSHASLPINTVTYWKDGKFYAVLNGVPYMVDESLNSSFVSCATTTMIRCNILPEHLWYPSADNLYFDGNGYILLDTGTAAVKYNLVGYNGAGAPSTRTTITCGTAGGNPGTAVPAIDYDGVSHYFAGTTNYEIMQIDDYVEILFKQHAYDGTNNRTILSCSVGTFNSPGFDFFIPTITTIRCLIDSSSFADVGGNYSAAATWFGCRFNTTSRIQHANSAIGNLSSNFRQPVYPLAIGRAANAAVGFYKEPIGPILHYRGINPPIGYATFLANRLKHVQDGTWTATIDMRDLVMTYQGNGVWS